MSLPVTTTIRFSEEQAMMLETAVDFCAKQSPVAKVRELLDAEPGYDPNVWREMIDLGWVSLAIPEAHGGSGLGLAEAVTLVEPMGRRLLNTPFVSTTVAAQALLHGGSDEQRSTYLKRISDGAAATVALFEQDGHWDLRQIDAVAERAGERLRLSGAKTFVTDAEAAEFLIVSIIVDGTAALAIVDRDTLGADALARETVVDETRRSYRVDLTGAEIDATNVLPTDAFDAMRNAALLLQTAEMCGGIAGALDVLIEYLTTRKQFGRYIGSYQALKHPTVDVLVGLEQSRSHLYHAASVMGTEEEEVAVRMANAAAAEAFAFAGDRAVQFHGGFGFTYECDAQLYLRRAMWCQYQFGDAQHHRNRLGDLLF